MTLFLMNGQNIKNGGNYRLVLLINTKLNKGPEGGSPNQFLCQQNTPQALGLAEADKPNQSYRDKKTLIFRLRNRVYGWPRRKSSIRTC
jgi:hypothetical protein